MRDFARQFVTPWSWMRKGAYGQKVELVKLHASSPRAKRNEFPTNAHAAIFTYTCTAINQRANVSPQFGVVCWSD